MFPTQVGTLEVINLTGRWLTGTFSLSSGRKDLLYSACFGGSEHSIDISALSEHTWSYSAKDVYSGERLNFETKIPSANRQTRCEVRLLANGDTSCNWTTQTRPDPYYSLMTECLHSQTHLPVLWTSQSVLPKQQLLLRTVRERQGFICLTNITQNSTVFNMRNIALLPSTAVSDSLIIAFGPFAYELDHEDWRAETDLDRLPAPIGAKIGLWIETADSGDYYIGYCDLADQPDNAKQLLSKHLSGQIPRPSTLTHGTSKKTDRITLTTLDGTPQLARADVRIKGEH